MKSRVLKTENLHLSKYDHLFGHYKHGQVPTKCLHSIVRRHEKKARTRIPIPKEKYRSRMDCNCKDCAFEIGKSPYGTFKPFVEDETTCRISVPRIRHYALVRRKLRVHGKHAKSSAYQNVDDLLTDLDSWIFTPTHQRSRSGNLNFTHSMVNGNDKFRSYIHILVVRRSQFEEYAECWGPSHVIMELPDNIPHIDETAEIGKIGYARLFIQLVAEKFGLETIFMIDDNVPCLYEIKTKQVNGKWTIEMENDRVRRENVPLYRVLRHMEAQFDGSGKLPRPYGKFSPHPDISDKNSLEAYTGPTKHYGVMGILRNSRFSCKVKVPFKNTHVSGIIFVNIKALQEKGIRYKPWPAWEDLTLNNDCDQNNLYVVKWNRYSFVKRAISDWLPKVFVWDEATKLADRPIPESDPAERSVDILLNYIQSWAAPLLTKLWPEEADEEVPDMRKLREKVSQLSKYKHHIVFFYPKTNLELVSEYFSQSEGLENKTHHIMVFPTKACRKFQLQTVSQFRSAIIDQHFTGADGSTEPDFEVVTSHNIEKFEVQMVLIYVYGRGNFNLQTMVFPLL